MNAPAFTRPIVFSFHYRLIDYIIIAVLNIEWSHLDEYFGGKLKIQMTAQTKGTNRYSCLIFLNRLKECRIAFELRSKWLRSASDNHWTTYSMHTNNWQAPTSAESNEYKNVLTLIFGLESKRKSSLCRFCWLCTIHHIDCLPILCATQTTAQISRIIFVELTALQLLRDAVYTTMPTNKHRMLRKGIEWHEQLLFI